MTQQMLWQRNLQRTSFFIAVSVLERTWSRNFALTMLNVDSTLERRWYLDRNSSRRNWK